MSARTLAATLLKVLVYIFAAIGFGLVVGYFAIKYGFTNQRGIIDDQRETFLNAGRGWARGQGAAADMSGSTGNATGVAGTDSISNPTNSPTPNSPAIPAYTGPWQQSEEWSIMSAAITRDTAVLQRAAAAGGVPPRIIVANLVTEQLRLFFTDRENYKKFFYPLKILGPQTQFSWGVMGMKEATATDVELHLKDPNSPYYLGPEYEHLLDFRTQNISRERFTRMTDQHDHFYSYLYAALYIKQIESAWARAGFPISQNPAVVSTLYNIGFSHSFPNADPKVGGASIVLSDGTRSFGALAAEFYNSDLLRAEFPR
jgi:hypothetical protein